MSRTLGDVLRDWAVRTPDREAVVGPARRRTYAELAADVAGTATALARLGVRRGDVVAVRTAPDEDFWQLFLAVTSLGGIWMGLNPKHTRHEVEQLLESARPVLVLDLELDPVPTAEPDDRVLDAPDVLPSDAAAVVFTSGSSGRPKGALIPHRALTRCGEVQARHWFDSAAPRVVVNLPVSHVGCLGDLASGTLVAGGTLVMQPEFSATGVLELIERERITTWAAVPAALELSLREPAFDTTDLSSLERVVWSGGALPLAAARRLADRGLRLLNCFGMTETVGNVTFTAPDDDLETVVGTIGRPDPAYQIRLEDGEIQVRGDHVFLGYSGDPAATAAAFDGEWFRTGDLAEQRPDGALVLRGRRSDSYKSGGYNVYPREVELALEAHPDVLMAAVVAAPHELWGETGHAFVTTRTAVDPDALREGLRERLAGYKLPATVRVVDALPLLGVGKVDKQALRARLEEVPV